MSFALHPVFPKLTKSSILSFQFSSWYPSFSRISIKSTIIRPVSKGFHDYLNADGVFVPEGSENIPATSTILDDEDEGDKQNSDGCSDEEDSEEDEGPRRSYAFPELDAQIRESIKEYGSVFPKLNFSSPKDASWILPSSSPLKCTSPSDVYLLLKSSDFVTHDLSTETVFSGCSPASSDDDQIRSRSGEEVIDDEGTPYELELVLRKWYPIDRSRELRCFVRDNVLIGISQRDTNFYDFYTDPQIQKKVVTTVQEFWDSNVKDYWEFMRDYTMDVLLTRDLTRAHILDFNPYAPRTDPLLFTYEELLNIHLSRSNPSDVKPLPGPILKVIDSPSHLLATKNAPANQHNMVPFETLSLSSGRDIEEFAEIWKKEMGEGMK